eukprot:m.11010 g.11010  ORF g.11010 m.11010 type:complete len:172 (-) comp9739_c0_seq1:1341-1856(-)
MYQLLPRRLKLSYLCQRWMTQKPAVGVAAVVLNKASANRKNPAILMIQRGKEPKKGEWSFPGGRLELGETMAHCAQREVFEETNVPVDVKDKIVTAIDVITRGSDGKVEYHFVVVDLLAFGADVTPIAGDDAMAVQWIPMSEVTATVPCHDGIREALNKLELMLPTLVWPE